MTGLYYSNWSILCFAFAILITIGTAGCKKQATGSELKPIPTPAWLEGGYLLLRAERPDSDTFLMRHLTGSERVWYDRKLLDDKGDPNKTVFRYKPNEDLLEPVRVAEWNSAAGVVVDCSLNWNVDISPFSWNDRAFTLRFKGAPAKTIGAIVPDAILSPDGRLVAVLTAEGSYQPSPIPFLGGGKISGARHQEFRRLADGTRQGEALRFALGHPAAPPLGGCWTADGQFVVYTDSAKSRVWVVPVAKDSSAKTP